MRNIKLKSFVSPQEVTAMVKSNIEQQLGCYFNETEPCLSGVIATSTNIEERYWNLMFSFKETDSQKLITTANHIFEKKKRSPVFYIDPTCKPTDLVDHLIEAGYTLEREIWMSVQKTKSIAANSNLAIVRVNNSNFHDFINIYSLYFGVHSGEGYGAISPDYCSTLENYFSKKKSFVAEHIHMLALLDGHPVGCGSVHIDHKYAGLYNITTVPEFRKKGIGSYIALEATKLAQARNVERTFLQTQPGGSLQRLYENLGFTVAFETAYAYKN